MNRHFDASLIEIPRSKTKRSRSFARPKDGGRAPSLLCIALAVLCSGLSCKETPPEPPKSPTVFLKAEDASCTEAWLKASVIQQPATVALLRDNQRVAVLGLRSSDSLLIDEGLLPRRTYTYQLQKLNADSSVAETSPSAQLTTMDSTSHSFSFEIDTLGDGSSSVLYDVAIINDTLAYAVGEIYKRDSVGNWDPNAYNAVKWNGSTWQLKRIPFVGSCSAVDYPPIRAVWAFSETNILFARGGSIVRYDGTNAVLDCGMNSLLAGSINKIYATSPQDVYLVGNAGTIAHYDGTSWRRVESGTGLPLNDVWGGSNPLFGVNVCLIAASFKYSAGEKRLLRVKANGSVDTVLWPMQDRRVHSIWFDNRSAAYVSGGGIFRMNRSGGWREQPVPLYYTNRIRGNAENDIFTVGDFGIAAHFNGQTWRHFPEARLAGIYESLAVRGNLVIAVGWGGSRAFVLRGVRR